MNYGALSQGTKTNAGYIHKSIQATRQQIMAELCTDTVNSELSAKQVAREPWIADSADNPKMDKA